MPPGSNDGVMTISLRAFGLGVGDADFQLPLYRGAVFAVE